MSRWPWVLFLRLNPAPIRRQLVGELLFFETLQQRKSNGQQRRQPQR
jgi:hypothetical protein